MELGKKSHRFKKGETIDKIAKKYGHKSGDAIWKHEKNKKLRSKRKTASALAPGDILYIPLTQKEIKGVEIAINAAGSLLQIESDLYAGLADTYVECASAAASLEASRRSLLSSLKQAEASLFAAFASIRSAKTARETHKNPKKAAKLNEDLMKQVQKDIDAAQSGAKAASDVASSGNLPKPGAVKKAGSSVSSVFKELNSFISSAEADTATVSITGMAEGVFDTTSKAFSGLQREITGMTKASFWFDLFFFGDYELLDLEKEKDERIKKIKKVINTLRRTAAGCDAAYKVAIKIYDSTANSAKKNMDACTKRIKDLEKQIRSFPSLSELKKM